jgi:endonuclease I
MRGLTSGDKTLVANGVADVAGNTGFGVTRDFNYVDVSIPAGYYDTAIGRFGLDLRAALHNIIDNHTVRSYDYALTAFRTTDVKPNGKVWDVYSDIPDGTPAYEYDFDDTGQGAGENNGWNREHSWPQSWFGGGSPMMSDLWLLYPTDSYVNGMRSNWPYGEVDAPTKTSTNGSKLGPCVTPGYSGTAFEPIDPFKGDLARSQFYISTRYYGEDGGFSSSAATDHATILPWAVQQFLTWSSNDPVSWKERMRNGAIYVIQGNRNPFVDHPEFVRALYDSAAVADVSGQPLAADVRLRPNTPNPFASRTSIHFDLARAGRVSMRVFDVTGRSVRTLADGDYTAGSHRIEWDGRDDGGVRLDAGLYFCRLDSGGASDTRRVVFAK